MAERDLVVRFIGDDRDLQRAFKGSTKQAQGFQAQITGVGRGITRAFGAAGIALGSIVIADKVRDSISAASDLNEQLSRTKVILGEDAQETIEWSRTTARAFGISQREALAASATFAGLFQTVGVGRSEAADLSRNLVQLAADLASLQNSSPEEALAALRSGLVGEAEPLRRFNIFLSETRVQQEAMATTGKKVAAELTNQEKALARYNIILRDSIPAQGNFKDTSDELANQGRILKARVDNLSTSLGNLLVPGLTDAAEAANFLFTELERLPGQLQAVDQAIEDAFSDLGLPAADKSLLELLGLEDEATRLAKFGGSQGLVGILQDVFGGDEKAPRPEAAGPGKGIGEDLARRRREEAKELERQASQAERDRERSRRAFADLSKGLGLKIDRAGLTTSLDDDIAALRELERAILRQIDREGRTFKLVEQLTRVRLELQSTVAQRAEDQARRSEDAFENMLGSLDLKLDRATDTARLDDDLRALRIIEAALRRRIESEGSTLELEQRLLNVRREQAEVRKRLVEQQQRQRESRQFRALGLTAEGEERIPSASALRRRLGSLEDQIKGTPLDTQKTRSQLERISRVLSGQFGKVGKDVRAAIQRMFDEIRDALEGGDLEKSGKKITKQRVTDPRKILQDLGLTEEQMAELRRRIISGRVGASGETGAFGQVVPTVPGAPGAAGFGGALGAILIETHIEVDGREIAVAVNRHNVKKGRRNPSSRRGATAGRPHGI